MNKSQDQSSMLVRDYMTLGVPVCSPGAGIDEIAELVLQANTEAVVVLDETGHAAGYIDQEVLFKAFIDRDRDNKTAESIMKVEIPEVPADIPVEAAVKIMLDNKLRIIFINHHAAGRKYPAGMLSYRNILLYLAHHDIEEVGIQARRKSPLESFIERREAARTKNVRTKS